MYIHVYNNYNINIITYCDCKVQNVVACCAYILSFKFKPTNQQPAPGLVVIVLIKVDSGCHANVRALLLGLLEAPAERDHGQNSQQDCSWDGDSESNGQLLCARLTASADLCVSAWGGGGGEGGAERGGGLRGCGMGSGSCGISCFGTR